MFKKNVQAYAVFMAIVLLIEYKKYFWIFIDVENKNLINKLSINKYI
jgi:hypothetical protein